MRPRVVIGLLALLVVASVGSLQAVAGGGERFSARMNGYQETDLTLSVAGTGTFTATLAADGGSISYRLRYSGLTGPALFAHIHLGRPAITGGVIAFLCDSSPMAPPGIPDCPGAGGTVNGTIEPGDVIGPSDQGIEPGEFDELVAALRAKAAYANVHSAEFPGGEIRGRIT
jgi:CHRD domain-containing protein